MTTDGPRITFFIAGPPGAGKTALAFDVARKLDLRFMDFSSLDLNGKGVPLAEQKKMFEDFARTGFMDVVVLSWPLQQDNSVLKLARRSGCLILIWDHPDKMNARAPRPTIFTPTGRAKTHSGFGPSGTACNEFRRLDRACRVTILLSEMEGEEAVEWLEDVVQYFRERSSLPPAVQAEIASWGASWQKEYDADPVACELMLDAMGRFLLHLDGQGASERTLRAVRWDLNAAGGLVLSYDAPSAQEVLGCFRWVPWELEFRRKIADSPRLVKRYGRNLSRFARFLREHYQTAKCEKE